MKNFKFVLLSVLIFTTFNACINTHQNQETIKVGVIIPLTGEYAEYGKNIQNALNIALKEIINKDNKYHYELIFEDDQAKPKMAISAIKKLISADKIKYIIGGFTSSSSVAIYPIAEKNRVILFSPSSSTPKLTKNTPYFFRNWPSDEVQAKKYAEYTFNEFNKKKVSTVYSLSDYGVFANKVFSQHFEKLGGSVLGQHGYNPNNTEFRTIITKLIEENPESVWLFGYYNEMGPFLKQAKALGLNTQFFGQEGIESEDLIKIAGIGANGLIYFVPYFNPKDGKAKEFAETYKKKYSKNPEVFGAHAYDVLNIYYFLIEKYGNNEEIIKDKILKIQDYNGISGITSFDKDGNATKPLMIKTIKNMKFKPFYK